MEHLYVEAQMSCDGILLSIMPALAKHIEQLVPLISAKELKQQMAGAVSKEEKAAVMARTATRRFKEALCELVRKEMGLDSRAGYAVVRRELAVLAGEAP